MEEPPDPWDVVQENNDNSYAFKMQGHISILSLKLLKNLAYDTVDFILMISECLWNVDQYATLRSRCNATLVFDDCYLE